MSPAASIIREVESALHDASNAKRGDVLRRVTDLFVEAAATITAEHTQLFDGVMGQLISHIESRALIELSGRLAPLANAPHETVRALARHNDITIAGPILAGSARLTEEDLVEIAKTISTGHLAKISSRAHLGEALTDVLVERGDAEVANGLATNPGARFSQIGMAKLVMRADSDDRLTESVARRADIPPRLFRQLLAQATEVVRHRLLTTAAPGRRDEIARVLGEISTQIAPNPVTLPHRREAQSLMENYDQDTELLIAKILEYASLRRVPEVIAGLAILSGVAFEQIDRLFFSLNGLGLMILCKSLTFDWRATHAIIMASHAAEEQLEDLCVQYDALTVVSAQRLIRFWKARQKLAEDLQKAS